MNKFEKLVHEASEVLLGKEEQIRIALSSCLAGGHVLLEDVPGVGKTTLVLLLGKLLGMKVKRIQFTNDLLPGDILGSTVYHKESDTFEFKRGPIFGELILADELNRATAKTQSALLQVMEEGKVSVDGQEFVMEEPFLIMGTQNPFYQLGTFPLPESQIDRFFVSIVLGFPERNFEEQILLQQNIKNLISQKEQVLSKEDILAFREELKEIEVSKGIINYILDLLTTGRTEFEEGKTLSPRGGKDLLLASKAVALVSGRHYILPEDVQLMAPPVLGHRLGGRKGVLHGQYLAKKLIEKVPLH